MAKVSALAKHPCPECGGDAEWSASKKALCCPYCGTILPWTHGDDVHEHDLEEALARIGEDQRGMGGSSRSVKCESCHAISVFDRNHTAQRCEFCGSPAIIRVDDMLAPITPDSLLPAVVAASEVRTRLRKWYGSRWFAPNKLRRLAQTDTLRGVYIPYWTFDAYVDATWTALSGYHYYVSQSYTDSNGRAATRRVRRTRWVPSSGAVSHFFDDELVAGTMGVDEKLLRQIEPFPTIDHLRPYDPAYVRGWTVERYQIDLRKASAINRDRMDDTMDALCAAQVPGDTHRALVVEAIYQNRKFKHILVPIWLTTYTYGRRSFQVIVNGYTGAIAGKHPLSWIKITLAVVAAIIACLLFIAVLSGAFGNM